MSLLNFLYGYLLGRSHNQSVRQSEPISLATTKELFPESVFELVDETITCDNSFDPDVVSQLVENLHRDPRLHEIIPPGCDGFESSFDSGFDANFDPYDASADYPDSFCGDGFGGGVGE